MLDDKILVVVPGMGGLEMEVDEKFGLWDGLLVEDNNDSAPGIDKLDRDDPDLSCWNASDEAAAATTAAGL